MSQGDFFTKIGIKRFVFVGHGNPDRDVVASMYMWCSCLGLDWRDGRIIYEFVHSGNCLEDDSVIHPVSNERIELDNSVLVIHFDTGRKYIPFEAQAFASGIRTFFYDHHQLEDNRYSATGLVFLAHRDRLQQGEIEHLEVIADLVDDTDNGRRFNLRDHYELGVLLGLANVLRGLNYRNEMDGTRARKNSAFFAENVFVGFGNMDSCLTARRMYRWNLDQINRCGHYRDVCGFTIFHGDGFSISGDTTRHFLQQPRPFPGRQAPIDISITSHRGHRLQLIVHRKDIIHKDMLSTTAIAERLKVKYPDMDFENEYDGQTGMYVDSRGFCIYVAYPVGLTVDDMMSVVVELIEERQETFASMLDDDHKVLLDQVENIALIDDEDERAAEWAKFISKLDIGKQTIATRIFLDAIQLLSESAGQNDPSSGM